MMKYETLFSHERLRKFNGFDDYLNNIAYSQSHYARLHLIEVALRNKINTVLVNKFELDWLINIEKIHSFFTQDSISIIKNTHQKLLNDKSIVTNGDIVSNLTFGFWVSLFSKRYYKNFTTKEIKSIFNISRNLINESKLSGIYHDLAAIKNFRNRIFHYEKVNNHQSYRNIEQLLDKYLKLIDVDNILSNSIRDIQQKISYSNTIGQEI
ncbi:MAG: hypothetical protein K2P99_07665 [Burkholderiales bacterium]|nr:hypothetical protein [Burkholderiales bacterium]